jgi:glycosyltransferase involved in cell wall biosynthesis
VDLPSHVTNKVLRSRLSMVLWDNLRLGPAATDDVILYPSFSRPLVTRRASVVTTHDATMRIVPHLFTRRDRLIYDPLYGWSARAATLVLTTSEAAKRDIVKAWDVDPWKIRVTPLAAGEEFHPLAHADPAELRRELLGQDVPYFMFAGKISGRRNLPELLRAFSVFKSAGARHKLVMVGPAYAVEAVNVLAQEFGVQGDLITFSFVSDEKLNTIYNCADAFIMPSVYENGSLPVFEAQAAGTPVVSVATEGTLEITGGEALLIPKLEVAALVEAMTRIAEDESLRSDLSRRGLENSRRYSWERCAAETLAVCSEAAGMIG